MWTNTSLPCSRASRGYAWLIGHSASGYGEPSGRVWWMMSCSARPRTSASANPVSRSAAGFMYVHCWRSSMMKSASVAFSATVSNCRR